MPPDRKSDPKALDERLQQLARVPVLLVATDYDGTLAPIVEDPEQARPDRDAMVALRKLAALPHTHVTIVSGRALSNLGELTGYPEDITLIGSHGSEFDLDFVSSLPPEAAELRDRLIAEIRRIAEQDPAFGVEVKPASVAFHYRNASKESAERGAAQVLAGPASWDGVHLKRGKKVLELAVVPTSKGTALDRVRRTTGASACIFLGDDRTDEDGFAHLTSRDVGVKVGEGSTIAAYRVENTRQVARTLARLSELREEFLAGSDAVPIEDHAMLTDQRTLALVTPDARVVWMCVPRIDSPAIFAELLGGPPAGHFTVMPAEGDARPTQVYEGDSFHLKTSWPRLTVTDFLDCSGGRPMQRPGRTDLVRVIEGDRRVRIVFAPRLDFGRVHTRLEVREGGLAVLDTLDPIVLRAHGVEWTIEDEGMHHTAYAEIDLSPGEPVVLELRYGTGSLAPSIVTPEMRSEQTRRYWSSWAARLDVPSVEPDLCRRSALVLRGLVHNPTGAIAAAGTTSLPETIGGIRNWDYRYCWPRDAALAAAALVRLGSNGEALRLLDWLLGVLDTLPAPERLRPIYTVNGTDIPAEAEIAELAGYAGSRPVRTGNAAAGQLQLDVFGPIVELIHLLMSRGAPLSAEHYRLVEAMTTAVAKRWTEPDHGIWEIRGPMQHHVHSKVMCWQTVRLAAEISQGFLGREREDWEALADEIAADVLENGWSPRLNSFTIAYGREEVDASVLAVGLTGLLPPDDERFLGTIRATEKHLLRNGTVYRYLGDDGLPGQEGGFNLCTAWLIEAYALCGRERDARALFESYVTLAGPTGLMPEEVDPESGLGLGNHPQAYTHLGLINAAIRLASLRGSGRVARQTPLRRTGNGS